MRLSQVSLMTVDCLLHCRMQVTAHFPSFAAGHGAGLLAFMALVTTDYGRATSGCHGGIGQVPLASHGETQDAVKHLLMLRA